VIRLIAQIASPETEGLEIFGDPEDPLAVSIMGLLNNYTPLFIVAFVVTLLATPLVRRAAMAANIVDRPDANRKAHRQPVPYLGGIAVFAGVLVAIGLSYFPFGGSDPAFRPLPLSIIVGMFAITFTGLADDMWGWHPRLKLAGQLVAAAALAIEDVGVRVTEGLLKPVLLDADHVLFALEGFQFTSGHVYYWVGTALIAVFVLGACNAANLLDGLDGLLSGTVAIIAAGLLAICILMALTAKNATGEPTIAGARIALCLALLGAVLGFLPHNFNPATIFLGDCGSLLLGYLCIVIILMLGDAGQTPLVFAGLIIFALPIMDTTLAIVRRKLSGRSMSDADDRHIHHQMLRALGGVRRAVVALYGISFIFALVGVSLALLLLLTEVRVLAIYAIAVVLFGFIGVMAFKSARRHELAGEAMRVNGRAEPMPSQPATAPPPKPSVRAESPAPTASSPSAHV